MRPVVVQFLKNPDHLHWGFDAWYLGEDEWGDWISVPAGSNRWKGETTVRPTQHDAVFCAPRDGWWHLHYNGPTSNYSHFVDIVTPPRWIDEGRYEMVDLDLDVAVHQDGAIEVQDEDEFAIHQVRYAYTQEMIDEAVAETERIVAALAEKDEPFFRVAANWLDRI